MKLPAAKIFRSEPLRALSRWTVALVVFSSLLPCGVAESADRLLYSLLADDWEWQKRNSPAVAQFAGDRRWTDAWPDLSSSALAALRKTDARRLRALRKLNSKLLSPSGRLDYRLFERDLLNRLEALRLRAYLTPFWQFERFGPPAVRILPFVATAPRTPARLDGFARYVDQQIALLRDARARHMLPAREVVSQAIAAMSEELHRPVESSVFYRSYGPNSSGPEREDARRSIIRRARPALQRLHGFLLAEVLPYCPVSPSLTVWPNGTAMYRLLLRLAATHSSTPEELHGAGLREVQRIRERMAECARSVGYEGTLQEFVRTAQSDPRFHLRTEEDVLRAYRSALGRATDAVERMFGRLPLSAPELAARRFGPAGPAASYAPPAPDGSRPGTVLVNVSDPESRPSFEVLAVMLHEGVPGHHLQHSFQAERAVRIGSPAAERLRRSEAFSEGWALYAETLGHELGLYTDPYERFGQLTQAMVRAVRLVIDTGIHAKGWSREQAVSYFIAQTGKTRANAEGEVSRSMWDPASVVTYKAGELAIRAMRERVQQRLGRTFDLRAFHEFLLRTGPLPLDLLESEFEAWVESKRKAGG